MKVGVSTEEGRIDGKMARKKRRGRMRREGVRR